MKVKIVSNQKFPSFFFYPGDPSKTVRLDLTELSFACRPSPLICLVFRPGSFLPEPFAHFSAVPNGFLGEPFEMNQTQFDDIRLD